MGLGVNVKKVLFLERNTAWNNYNDWEKIVIKTTTNGIPMVVVNYNEWEIARYKK